MSSITPSESVPESYKIRGVNPYRLEAIKKYGGQSILDAGCGSGAYVFRLCGEFDIRGIDAAPYDSWREQESRFRTADVQNLPFEDGEFETVCSFEVLEHLPEPGVALREFYRVCRRNIIITVPNCDVSVGMRRSNLLFSHWEDPTHRNFYDMETIKQAVLSAGFKVADAYPINPISLAPFLLEAFAVPNFLTTPVRTLVKPFIRRDYYLTNLVVGAK